MSEFVWGVDPAISHIAIAYANTTTNHVQAETLLTRTEEREGARLGLLDRRLRHHAQQAARRFPPACVWVEQPSGPHPNPQLFYAVGVIQAALFEALTCPVWTMPSSTWKKTTLGYGNASKAQVAAWVEGRGHRFEDQDEADAIAIACAGRAMLLARSWEAAA